MGLNKVEQVNNTRNQSTAKYTHEHIFLGNNKYDEKTLTNAAEGDVITLQTGQLIMKSAAAVVDVLDAAANIGNVVGILTMDADLEVADAASVDVNIATEGIIAEECIILPAGVTLDTVIPTTVLTLRDRLNELGFHLETSTENTKFDNV